MKKITILSPFYNEEKGVDLYFETVLKVLESIEHIDYELICIDDGSTDNTFEKLKDWYQKNKKIKVYSLSRNFGKEIALTCGLDHSTGDCVIPIDSDLQHPPKLIPKMISKWEKGFNVVLMRRRTRDESIIKKITAKLFYKIINKISDSKVYNNVGDFRLLDRQVVNVITNMRESTRFMKGIMSWPGYRTSTLEFDQPDRSLGEAKQNYRKLFKLALDGIFSFSITPLKISTFLGALISCSSFIYAIIILIQKLTYNIDLPGYASLIIIILFLGGIQLLSIGILGEYIARIFSEVKQRPLYAIETSLE